MKAPQRRVSSRVAVGPLESTFQSMAGDAWVDWLYMIGLLGIGVALVAGVGLRIAAAATTVLMALMWVAEWPLAMTPPRPVIQPCPRTPWSTTT